MAICINQAVIMQPPAFQAGFHKFEFHHPVLAAQEIHSKKECH